MKSSKALSEVINNVRDVGFSVCEGFLSPDECRLAIACVDQLLSRHPSSVSVTSSDSRIFGAEFLHNFFKHEIYDSPFINEVLSELYCVRELLNKTVLAQHVEAIPGNSGSGGVWHRDSLPAQYKAFLYFNEITCESGPLQLIPSTHKPLSKAFAAAKRGWRWNSLDYDSHGDLDKAIGSSALPVSITGKPGTLVFVNTSILHRGKPGVTSERYSATLYAFKKQMPNHIERLMARARSLG